MTPITAQFLHQHTDKVVWEDIVIIDSLQLKQFYADGKIYLLFDIPICKFYRPLIQRWYKSDRLTRLTKRSVRFLDLDGITLYQLSKRPFKAKLDIADTMYNFPVIKMLCKVEKEDACELSKIFQK